MTTDDIILHIFYLVATRMPAIPRHSQAKLYPSELVTISILFALKPPVLAFFKGINTNISGHPVSTSDPATSSVAALSARTAFIPHHLTNKLPRASAPEEGHEHKQKSQDRQRSRTPCAP